MTGGIFQYHLKKQGSVENSNSIGLQSYQKVILSSIENKKQVILSYLMNSRDKLFDQENIQRHKLVVTGEDP